MPEEFSMSSHFNDNGSVNTDGPGLRTLAGEGHEETKCFDDVKDFKSLCKLTADTKTLVGTQGEQLKTAILPLAENASDEDKAVHRSKLNSARGAPKTGAEYELNQLEGLKYDPEKTNEFREFMCSHEVPKDTGKLVWDWYHNYVKTQNDSAIEAETTAETGRIEKLQTAWVGDKMVEMTRYAYNAIMAFGPKVYPDFFADSTDKDGNTIKGAKTLLEELKVYDSPGDFGKWAKAGIGAEQILLYSAIGEAMKSGSLLNSEGQGGQDKGEAFEDACSSKSSMAKRN